MRQYSVVFLKHFQKKNVFGGPVITSIGRKYKKGISDKNEYFVKNFHIGHIISGDLQFIVINSIQELYGAID